MDLNNIESPAFLKDLSQTELEDLAIEIRKFLIKNISQTGGHLASNLGIVELSIALHKVFNSPQDKIFFDVGHQSYVHKILTGRASDFPSLRQFQGLSGYQKRAESEHDCFEAGHSSTTISAGIGMAIARDLDHDNYEVLPVIGDGSLTGGLALEALNHLAEIDSKVIVIINDNDMSISKNVGGVNHILGNLRISMPYNKAKQNYKEFMSKNKVGEIAYKSSKKVKDLVKKRVIGNNMFIDMGLDYIGPIDGHDFHDLLRALKKAKASKKSIIVHVWTNKGKGYRYAEDDTDGSWHGTSAFDYQTGQKLQEKPEDEVSFSKAIADAVKNEMTYNEDIICISPAMVSGSALQDIFKEYPRRSFDVGIAEQHATMMAAGLSLSGKRPFLSIYSSFSQRAYDQFNHDLARLDLPLLIGLDRAGLVGEDGSSHHGVFDITMFRNLPNFVITAPKDFREINNLVKIGLQYNHPFIIRYPRGNVKVTSLKYEKINIGEWKTLKENKKRVLISYGPHSRVFEEQVDAKKCGVIHALFIKPLDHELLDKLFKEQTEIIIYEPDIKGGGFASSILEYANTQKYDTSKVEIISIDDKYIECGSIDVLLKDNQLDYDYVIKNYAHK